VEEDETEGGYRAVLNFGHTLGHAVESATEYREFLHGEAVAMGMVFAARLSQQRGLCSEATYERIRQLIKKVGLPVEVPAGVKGEHLALVMETDKKTAAGKIKFVCIEEIGKTRFEYLNAKEIMGYL
jgi:3-dehydroquinate synthase